MLLPSGNLFKCHEEVLSLQPMIPPNRFDIFPPDDWGMLRRSRCVQIFLEGCSKHSGRFAGLEACFLLVTVRFFCSWSTNSDESTPLNTRVKEKGQWPKKGAPVLFDQKRMYPENNSGRECCWLYLIGQHPLSPVFGQKRPGAPGNSYFALNIYTASTRFWPFYVPFRWATWLLEFFFKQFSPTLYCGPNVICIGEPV